MEIKIVSENKKQFIDLLLLADEQQNMIDRYLERGTLFALYEKNCVKCVCVVTKEKKGIYEIKNLAVDTHYKRQGYGTKMLKYIFDYYKNVCDILFVGTGDSDLTIPFYKSCGFVYSHKVKNFFIEHYNAPIFECGVQLVDMIYLKKLL
ncbi:GNAT family N-acetyltransferase [Clostridium sp. MD294]|uniref:GNAT family N-acetyltransferase n=1 Tax=Clostridium sp. MD294 TaxID=97138 RepID=UPI0002CC6729|nr:GNAT family N-acetyltransferase [Clostridium sp. MD294]USF30805.1 putative N-acetyltransferase YvbK [Clostridium sp. MD294]